MLELKDISFEVLGENGKKEILKDVINMLYIGTKKQREILGDMIDEPRAAHS